MWKAERMGRIRRKHNTDTDATKGDGEEQNSREEHNRRAENGREQMETDGDGRRMFENKFYVTHLHYLLNGRDSLNIAYSSLDKTYNQTNCSSVWIHI